MKLQSLHDVYVNELKDIFNAENQLLKALPKMAKAACHDALREGFEDHLEQTEGQVHRLETIFQGLGMSPKGKKCKGMEGLIEEGKELFKDSESAALDAALIAAAQKVEHYEIASYGTLRTYARLLGYEEAANLLQQTLNEEASTDKKLTELAEQINAEAEKLAPHEDMARQPAMMHS